MNDLTTFVQRIPDFSRTTHADKIKLFAWFLHSEIGKDTFTTLEITQCYEELHLERPTSINPFLRQMEQRKPKVVLRTGDKWRLEHKTREALSKQYGDREITVQIAKLLEGISEKVPDHKEKEFLNEALICYRRGAFRAATVMVWNLAYYHTCEHILRHSLVKFNATYQTRLPGKWSKAKVVPIVKYDDFSADLKESEVIDIAKWGGLISGDVYKILEHSLDRRNSAAHPSLNSRSTES